jgi:uncharacterized protein with HEPN domain
MSSRRWKFFVEDILKSIGNIESYLDGIAFEDFSQNDLLIAAVERKFIVIGEAVRHIPLQVKEIYPSIPWRQMADMRNLVTHVYWGVNPRILWDTVFEDLPPIIPLLERILEEQID